MPPTARPSTRPGADTGLPKGIEPRQAVEVQKRLAERVVIADRLPKTVSRVAGVDVSFPRPGRVARAAVAVFGYPKLDLIERYTASRPVGFPYVPGLLSFRELPVILEALDRLDTQPDLVLCDGQGIAHPRRFGIACHLGVATGLASIGVGKTRLCGTHATPGPAKGAVAALVDGRERIGSVVRTRTGVKPLFVSPGHRVDHALAVQWVMACLGRFRLPEPIRAADRLSREGR